MEWTIKNSEPPYSGSEIPLTFKDVEIFIGGMDWGTKQNPKVPFGFISGINGLRDIAKHCGERVLIEQIVSGGLIVVGGRKVRGYIHYLKLKHQLNVKKSKKHEYKPHANP